MDVIEQPVTQINCLTKNKSMRQHGSKGKNKEQATFCVCVCVSTVEDYMGDHE